MKGRLPVILTTTSPPALLILTFSRRRTHPVDPLINLIPGLAFPLPVMSPYRCLTALALATLQVLVFPTPTCRQLKTELMVKILPLVTYGMPPLKESLLMTLPVVPLTPVALLMMIGGPLGLVLTVPPFEERIPPMTFGLFAVMIRCIPGPSTTLLAVLTDGLWITATKPSGVLVLHKVPPRSRIRKTDAPPVCGRGSKMMAPLLVTT